MNLEDVNTQLIFTTVPIWVHRQNGAVATGTGFFFQHQVDENSAMPFIVTNAHVVSGATKAFISIIKSIDGSPALTNRVTAELPVSILDHYLDSKLDIAMIPVGPIIRQLKTQGFEVFFKSITAELIPNKKLLGELSAIEEVNFVGYPSGIFDQENSLPIVRKGITATPIWNNFNGKPIFLIDAGVFPGSSGSPVFIANSGSYVTKDSLVLGNRVLFLGMLGKTLQRKEVDGSVYLGLGEVLRSDKVSEYIQKTADRLGG